jgi:hypothetical protein
MKLCTLKWHIPNLRNYNFLFSGTAAQLGPKPFLRFLDHTHTHTHTHHTHARVHAHTHARTHRRTPLNASSGRRTSRYLHNAQLRKRTSRLSEGFEPAIPAIKRPQTYTLGRRATGIGKECLAHSLKLSPELRNHALLPSSYRTVRSVFKIKSWQTQGRSLMSIGWDDGWVKN